MNEPTSYSAATQPPCLAQVIFYQDNSSAPARNAYETIWKACGIFGNERVEGHLWSECRSSWDKSRRRARRGKLGQIGIVDRAIPTHAKYVYGGIGSVAYENMRYFQHDEFGFAIFEHCSNSPTSPFLLSDLCVSEKWFRRISLPEYLDLVRLHFLEADRCFPRFGLIDVADRFESLSGAVYGSVIYLATPINRRVEKYRWVLSSSRQSFLLQSVYWGNYLGQRILDRLGGDAFIQRYQQQAVAADGTANALCWRFPNGVFLSVSMDPSDCFPQKNLDDSAASENAIWLVREFLAAGVLGDPPDLKNRRPISQVAATPDHQASLAQVVYYDTKGALPVRRDFETIWSACDIFGDEQAKEFIWSECHPSHVPFTRRNFRGRMGQLEFISQRTPPIPEQAKHIFGSIQSVSRELGAPPLYENFGWGIHPESSSTPASPWSLSELAVSEKWFRNVSLTAYLDLVRLHFSVVDCYRPLLGIIDVADQTESLNGAIYRGVTEWETPLNRHVEKYRWGLSSVRQTVQLRSVYWGNYLGQPILDRLGGDAFIQRYQQQAVAADGTANALCWQFPNGVFLSVSLDPSDCFPQKNLDESAAGENTIWLVREFLDAGVLGDLQL